MYTRAALIAMIMHMAILPALAIPACDPCVPDDWMLWMKTSTDHIVYHWPSTGHWGPTVQMNLWQYTPPILPSQSPIEYSTSTLNDDIAQFASSDNAFSLLDSGGSGTIALDWVYIPSNWDEGDDVRAYTTAYCTSDGKLPNSIVVHINCFKVFPAGWTQSGFQAVVRHEIAHAVGMNDNYSVGGITNGAYGSIQLTMTDDERCVFDEVYSTERPSCDDKDVYWCGGNSMANVVDVDLDDSGALTWRELYEDESISYRVAGWNESLLLWQVCSEALTPGNGLYSWAPQQIWPAYRLLECDASGASLCAGTAVVEASKASQQAAQVATEICGMVSIDKNSADKREGSSPRKCLVVAPAAMMYVLSTEYKAYWENRGDIVMIESLDALSLDQDARRSDIRSLIAEYYNAGYRYVLLVGDANDYREFAGDRQAALWCDDYWAARRVHYVEQGWHSDGQASKDVLPTYVAEELAHRNTARIAPYSLIDEPYADIDVDGVRDIALARLPLTTVAELQRYMSKMVAYCQRPSASGGLEAVVLAGDLPYGRGGGQLIEKSGDAIVGAMPSNAHLWRLNATDLMAIGISGTSAAQIVWNQVWPDVVVQVSTQSYRYSPGLMLSKAAWSWEACTAEQTPVVLSITCDSGDFAWTENSNQGSPMCEDMLFSDSSKGAIAWIGPTAGSYEEANAVIVERLVESICSPGEDSVAECFRQGINAARYEMIARPEMLPTVREYVYLGEPLCRLSHRENPGMVGISEGAGESAIGEVVVAPSPANGGTEIVMQIGKNLHLVVEVFNVRGMFIKRLYDGHADRGTLRLLWDGQDRKGQSVASGVYCVRVSNYGGVVTRKVVMVR